MISLGNTQMGLGLTVRLVDQFSARSSVVSSSMSRLQKQAYSAQAASLMSAKRIGIATALAGGIMTAAFANMSKSAADFEWIMTGTRAVTQATQADYKKMSNVAIDLSKKYIYSAIEVGSAMEYLGRAGFGVGNIYKTIEAVTRLGAATDTAIGGKGGAADMMTNMMTAFNMSAKDSGRMADILTYATTRANLDINDLHESMKFMGQAATDLKIPFQEAASMVSVLGAAGLRGGVAGRSLNNLLLYIAKATGKFRTKRQADVLKSLGIAPKDLKTAAGELKPMGQLLDVFGRGLNKLSSPDKVASLQALFNIRGARALTPLLRTTKLGLSFSEMLDEIHRKSKGVAQNIAEMRMDTIKGQATILLDVWKAMKIEIGTIINPYVKVFLKNMQQVVSWVSDFVKTPMGKPIVLLAAAASIAALVLGTMTFALATIRIGNMAAGVSGVSAANGIAAAWGNATASAMRYNMVSKASWIGGGGQVAMKGVKGFMSTRGGMAAGAGVASGFVSQLSRATPLLGRMVGFLGGPWGMLAMAAGSILAMFVDWGVVWKYLKYATLGIINAFKWVADYVSSGFDLAQANQNFMRRDYNTQQALGMMKGGTYDEARKEKLAIIEQKKEEARLRAITNGVRSIIQADTQRSMFNPSANGKNQGPYANNPFQPIADDPALLGKVARTINLKLEIGGQKFTDLVLNVMRDHSVEITQ